MPNLKYQVLLVLVIFASCLSNNSNKSPIYIPRTIEFPKFKLKVPGGWEKLDVHDSVKGSLTNGKDTLFFEFGENVPIVGREDVDSNVFAMDTIDGFLANVVMPISKERIYIRMSIEGVYSKTNFFIECKNAKNVEDILDIITSIQFPEGDKHLGYQLTKSDFSQIGGNNEKGGQIYRTHCETCHHVTRNILGPSFEEILKIRDRKWLTRYLTDPKFKYKDGISKDWEKSSGGLECIAPHTLTQSDVAELYKYIKYMQYYYSHPVY